MLDGYISMDNKQLFLDINRTKNDLKSRGGWLGVFFVFVSISVLHTFRKMELLKNFFDYFDFGLRIIGVLGILAALYYLFFLRKSKKNLIINEIIKINIDKKEFETEISLVFTNKREYDISFRNLENQLEPFLEQIKKRNTRIIINDL